MLKHGMPCHMIISDCQDSPPLPSPLLHSVAVCTFTSRVDTEWYVVVGTAKDLTLAPRSCSGGSLILFRFSPDGSKLEHMHTVSLPWAAVGHPQSCDQLGSTVEVQHCCPPPRPLWMTYQSPWSPFRDDCWWASGTSFEYTTSARKKCFESVRTRYLSLLCSVGFSLIIIVYARRGVLTL